MKFQDPLNSVKYLIVIKKPFFKENQKIFLHLIIVAGVAKLIS